MLVDFHLRVASPGDILSWHRHLLFNIQSLILMSLMMAPLGLIGDSMLRFDILIAFESFRHVRLLLENVRAHNLTFLRVHALID